MEEQNINFKANDSIKINIRRLFLMLILIGVTGFLVFLWNTSIIGQQAHKITDYRQKLINEVQSLRKGIYKLSYFTQQYILLVQNIELDRILKPETEELKVIINDIWDDEISSVIDKLNILLSEKNDNIIVHTDILYKNITKINKLKNRLFKVGPNENSKIIKSLKKLNEANYKINAEVKVIIQDQKIAINGDLKSLNQSNTVAGYGILVIFLVVILLAWQGSFRTTRKLRKDISTIENQYAMLLNGELPEMKELNLLELKNLEFQITELTESFRRLKTLADEVGTGNFDTDIRVFDDKGVLGSAIAQMRKSLLRISNENDERNWINEGYARFSEIFQNQLDDSKSFFETVISNLVNYLGMAQGAIFILEESKKGIPEENAMLLQATYAFQKIKYKEKKVEYGEGLVGRAWREKDVIHLTEIPESYIDISSGLGKAKPKSILVVPLISDDKVQGIVEIASFSNISKKEKEFMHDLAESLANTIEKVRGNVETQLLLEESIDLQEQMKAQEEEITLNMEKLEMSQEIVERESRNTKLFMKALSNAFLVCELDTQGCFISGNNLFAKTTGYSHEEIIGNHYSLLGLKREISELTKTNWRKALNGKLIEWETAKFKKNKTKFWVHEIMFPVLNSNNKVEKIINISYDITNLKEQGQLLTETTRDLKNLQNELASKIQQTEEKAFNRITKIKKQYQSTIDEKDKLINDLKKNKK